MTSTGNINLVYDGRITVQLGTMLDMEYKLKMAFHVIENELASTATGVVDAKQAGNAIFRPGV